MTSGLTVEGIYRLCGQQSVVTRLLNSLTTGELLIHITAFHENRCTG